jgi:hypothetical protein
MEQQYLTKGSSFMVKVKTPDGEELESAFDTMSNGPQIDSVYYSVKTIPTPDPTINTNVMQFYVDLDALGGDYSRYYKWEIVETWEYHAKHPVEFYYDGTHHEVIPPDYTNNVCWTTSLVKNVFTLSTQSLSQNEYQQYPMHSVDGTSSRLGILYSILVRQLALSKEAYNYWEKLRVNSNEQGGLYEKQPFAIKGNIQNLTNPDKDVLGFFYTGTVSERRYFYHDIEGIDLVFVNYFCSEDPPGRFGFKEFFISDYPVYYYYNLQGYLRILSEDCVNCRILGGTIVKPDFWPN